MPNETKLRKRLLYDLSPIPTPPVNKEEKGKLEPEYRVVYKGDFLVENDFIKSNLTIGSGLGADVVLDEDVMSADVEKVADVSGKKLTVVVNPEYKGYVCRGEEKLTFAELLEKGEKTVEIDRNSFVVYEFGDVQLCLLNSKKGSIPKGGIISDVDWVLASILLVVFLIGIYAVNAVIDTPPIELDIFEMDNRFAKLIVEADDDDMKVEEAEEEKKVELKDPKKGLTKAEQSRKSLGEEGRVGDKKSQVANAQGSARRGLDEKVAQSSGIMGALSSGAQSFDKVFGGGGLGAGMEKTLGSVTGLQGVDQFGSGGLGTRGFGSGGGGNALGIGGLGTRGRGGGGGGSGYGMAKGRVGRKGRSDISAGGGQAVIMGSLDRSVIAAYIRRNLAKIRWCYEKGLARDPKLFGKVVINFTIANTGKVSQSKVRRTTMGDKAVESCIAAQIRKIRFPKPKGGGIVIVNYPFVFKHSEG